MWHVFYTGKMRKIEFICVIISIACAIDENMENSVKFSMCIFSGQQMLLSDACIDSRPSVVVKQEKNPLQVFNP